MQVVLFVPDRFYGFCERNDDRVFFHLESFIKGPQTGFRIPPPPILGEEVSVEYNPKNSREGKAPRADRVVRMHPPQEISGKVDFFNSKKGWGFITGSDNTSYYLHRSDVLDRKLPIQGQEVWFYRGFKKNRPRACHVQVGRVSS